jgi:hypothetical protein
MDNLDELERQRVANRERQRDIENERRRLNYQ